MKKTHKDVEFAVDTRDGEKIFKRFDEAVVFAVTLAVSDGKQHSVDALIYSKAGARWWGGEHAVEMYEEDPEASVSDRIVISAESVGRIA